MKRAGLAGLLPFYQEISEDIGVDDQHRLHAAFCQRLLQPVGGKWKRGFDRRWKLGFFRWSGAEGTLQYRYRLPVHGAVIALGRFAKTPVKLGWYVLLSGPVASGHATLVGRRPLTTFPG